MNHRKKLVAGNWKMNKTSSEGRALVDDLIKELGKFDGADVVICPPFTALAAVTDLVNAGFVIRLGAQNFHEAASGAYTGEISALMLRDLFVRYVIVGHSERRQYFGETNELINKKAKVALQSELKPIVCVGETLQEREAGQWNAVLETQVKACLAGMTDDQFSELVVAYEPVWAIGTGKTASPEQAEEAHKYIRELVTKNFSAIAGDKVRILYGGSVKPDNARDLFKQPNIDGALVGGASLDARGFATIVKNACID